MSCASGPHRAGEADVIGWGLPARPPSRARPWWISSGGWNMHKRVGIILMLAALLFASAVPAHAWHGYYGFRRPRVVIVPRAVVPVVPFWAPYVYPPVVVAPPVYVQPPPQVSVQPPPQVSVQPPPQVSVQPPPPPQAYWYYCDNPQGYYPYVQQCPGGWRQVVPSPPQ